MKKLVNVFFIGIICTLLNCKSAQRSVQTLIDSGEIKHCFIGNGTLQLTHKNLTSLQGLESLKLSPEITLLDASHNLINSLEKCSFEKFPNLSQIWLNNNHIASLAPLEKIKELHNLKILDLSHNKITTLSNSFLKNIKNLKTLFLNHNLIEELPNLESLQNLRELHITHNRLEIFDQNILTKNTNLYVVNYGFNNIAKIIPSSNQPLRRLEVLFLNNNKLTSLQSKVFAQCPQLLMLYLQDNILCTLAQDCFENQINLRLLFLYNNLIKEIHPQTFSPLKNLRVLFARNNHINYLDNSWNQGLDSLELLDFSNNFLKQDIKNKSLNNLANLKHAYW